MNTVEKELNRTIVYDGKIMQVTKEEVELDNGQHAFREVVYHNGGVCILAIEDHHILFVKQFRYPNRIETLEIPAGKLEKDEDPRTCAFREFEEETNRRAQDMHFIIKFLSTPGFTSEWLYLYEAIDFKEVNDSLDCDDDECIEVIKMDIETAYQKVLNGEIIDAKTIIAIMYAYQKDSQ